MGVIVVVAASLVAMSLDRPELETWLPTSPSPHEVGAVEVGPTIYTVDARSPDRWTYFDFSRASVVEGVGALDWDLAFRRFHVMVNGGPGFTGQGGVLELGSIALDSVRAVPERGYEGSDPRADSVAPPLARWYSYGWTTHLLTPARRSYAVRTADGRYAVIELLGYYCPGVDPGCMTFRYRYQGSGVPRFGQVDAAGEET